MESSVKNKSLVRGIIYRLLCTHDYHLVNQSEIKSEFDIVHDSGRTPTTHCSITRKYIFEYKCSKCDKTKILVNCTSK